MCKKRPNERGKYTAATQQEACLRRSGAAVNEPWKALRKDLKEFIQQRVDSNHDIVLFGDFNEELGGLHLSVLLLDTVGDGSIVREERGCLHFSVLLLDTVGGWIHSERGEGRGISC